jgi:hypothetical protein
MRNCGLHSRQAVVQIMDLSLGIIQSDGRGIWHSLGTGVLDTEYWLRDLTERDHLEDLGVDRKIILK